MCTVHPILSARELHFQTEADSLMWLSLSPSLSLLSWPFRCYACPHINTIINWDSLAWRSMHHPQPFGPFKHQRLFLKKQAAMILCQLLLQADWPPISSASSFIIISTNLLGGKGHSWSHWWDKIRHQRREIEVDVRLALAYHLRVNAERAIEL